MLAIIFSFIAASTSVASFLTIRAAKREQDAAMVALRFFADGLSKANNMLQKT